MAAKHSTMPTSNLPERQGVYLITHPRSASNLFQTMMAKQPGHQNSSYKLFDAGFAALTSVHKGPLSEWPEDERKGLYDAYRAGWESLQDEIVDARKNGKEPFIKEHALFLSGPDKLFTSMYASDNIEPLILLERDQPELAHTNPTSLPDRFLLSMQPIFQIRHPAMMFPSMVRAQRHIVKDAHVTRNPLSLYTLTLRHSRALYDWYLEHADGRVPRIIDADDIMDNPAAVRQLCVETGFDPDAVQYEWEERTETDPLKAAFLSTIIASKGIVKGLDARNVDIAAEKVKWKAEFGDDAGEDIARFVYEAMHDYEYLLSRRTGPKAVT